MEDESHGRSLHTAVQGDRPDCLAVGLYRAAELEHAWLTATGQRVAVLRLRDLQNRAEPVAQELIAEAKRGKRGVAGLVRGAGKLVASSAVELARSMRRAPLAERPQDAVFECAFEVASGQLQSITPWKSRLLPTFAGGPRYVQVQFADGSWARLTTDEAGQARLTGTAAGR